MICRQSNHVFDREGGEACRRCGGTEPPPGPFRYIVEDLTQDRSREGTATTERSAKCGCSRVLTSMFPPAPPRYEGRLSTPGVAATIIAPDGRIWRGVPNCIGYPNWELQLPGRVLVAMAYVAARLGQLARRE